MDALGADTAIKTAEQGGRAIHKKTCIDDEAGLERLYDLIAALNDDTDGVLYKEDVVAAHGGDEEGLFELLETDVSGTVTKPQWLQFLQRSDALWNIVLLSLPSFVHPDVGVRVLKPPFPKRTLQVPQRRTLIPVSLGLVGSTSP